MNEKDREDAVWALKKSGLWDKISTFEDKENSVLTREFDEKGVVLSGGEYQKLSLARVFVKDYQIGIFDEPSSALDPVAEYKLFESIMETSKGKTVIFISHRLSTARLADRIYLFEDGRIAEEGTHDELMKLNGKYQFMFSKQAEKYAETEYLTIEGDMNSTFAHP